MSIADGIKDIVDDIENSRTARIAEIAELNNDVGEIRSAAQNMMHSFTSERKHNAADMRRTLKKGRKALGRETQNMLGGFSAQRMAMARDTRENLEDCTSQLTKDVSEIRLDAVNMVNGFADERVARSIELTRMLKTSNDGIKHDVMGLMDDFKKLYIPFQKDLAEAHGIWESHMRVGHTAARPGLKPEQTADQDLKDKVLTVIKNSPKGISLAKAGKKIGVEWRTLIRPTKELLEGGDVRKKDTYYFPT